MWSWRRRGTTSPAPPEGTATLADDAGGMRCPGTLVLHADGVLDCRTPACGAAPELHTWWIPCVELETPCGCLGDERPTSLLLDEAA